MGLEKMGCLVPVGEEEGVEGSTGKAKRTFAAWEAVVDGDRGPAPVLEGTSAFTS